MRAYIDESALLVSLALTYLAACCIGLSSCSVSGLKIKFNSDFDPSSSATVVSKTCWAVGLPVYTTLQKYLLCETWLLSRSTFGAVRQLLIPLLLLLVPFAVLFATTCGLHTLGYMNVQLCAKATGVYNIDTVVRIIVCFIGIFFHLI